MALRAQPSPSPSPLLLSAASAVALPLLLLCACGGVGVVSGAPPRRCEAAPLQADGTYSNRYDNVDVDAILNSGRLLKAYVDCIMERGSCTKEGCFLQAVIPDALNNECSKCNAKQKNIAGKVLAYMLQYHRDNYWQEILDKYDPTGAFRKRHEWVDEDDNDPDDE